MWQHLYKLYIIWFMIGMVLVGFDLIPPWLEWANSVFLILAGIVALRYAMQTFGRQLGSWLCVGIGISTFSIEGLSAHYDVFFGNYDYTTLFPPLLFGVPIGIGFAWIVMIMAGHALTVNVRQPLLRIVLASFYVVALDLVLDPVAYVTKGYWIWNSDSSYYGIPWTNFAGWFVTAFVWQVILQWQSYQQVQRAQQQMQVVFWTIFVLFVWLAALDQLYVSIVVSSALFIVLQVVKKYVGRVSVDRVQKFVKGKRG